MKNLRLRKPNCTPFPPRRSIAIAGGALAILVLVGCSGTPPVAGTSAGICPVDITFSAATVVVAATATSAEPAVALPPALRSRLRSQAVKGVPTCIAIVTPQGKLIALDVTPRRPNGAVENGPNRDRKVEQNLDVVASRLSTLAATGPGLDPLTVIDRAVGLHPTPGMMIVITSGVATETPTDLRTLGWDLDATEAAARLGRAGDIPSLIGWRVQFVGIGDVAGRQPPLKPALRQRLQNWWLAICRVGGAINCASPRGTISTSAPVSRNAVPVVPLPTPVVAGARIEIPNALLFAINSAVVERGAEQSLGLVVERALRTGESVRVTGYTDAITGSAGHNRQLSQRRADAVGAQLVRLGLPDAQLQSPKGFGSQGASVDREKADPAQVSRDRRVEITFSTVGRTLVPRE